MTGFRTFRSDVLLLLTAAIWGFAFVAQRIGMRYVGPFLFNGVRFALACLVLLPIMLLSRRKGGSVGGEANEPLSPTVILYGAMTGTVLFIAASLQQVGMVYTTAGKGGFITGLYVVIVPFLGLFARQRAGMGTWVGALLAAAGMYLLSITGRFSISRGDLLVLISALFWAGHVLSIGWLSPRIDSLLLAVIQYSTCSILSMAAALLLEIITLESILSAAVPILYGGILSVGVAYTFQIVAQRRAPAAHAAVIMSLEAVFAVLGGRLILGETLSRRGLVGCALMLSGMLVSQLTVAVRRRESKPG